ncbi:MULTISPECIES: mandelate racemase/muconate lactonizing enzyme family protein [unclassified Crossiella]|uniref:mandelate racemase/muconate lactonizing enzyme family protein n=1 Tax=unclassified Crossiella TaxID=2620835 RepID=UPI00200021D1|nr:MULTISPECIES: mandelate racemase/muconate lactonizing enzyme family protein [unclassified Crossiella]MCK2244798.1 mandelate racemase/muconate lactonizing enzyme family protein [Crossiella sp. S99.2]MCK2258440.1 mandelate racemase/muconate lactonizing enzyme family protein [Crossiella sp. S99.1]
MQIREIRAAGLRGGTPPGGWTEELTPEDVVHTLIAVHTDTGQVGIGSCSSSEDLVRAALALLEPLYRGQSALEPERLTERLHQHTFWLGRGGAVTHAISGIDLALWDLLGQSSYQPVGRLLGGRYRDRVRPYASVLMDQPHRLTEELLALRANGFRAFKIGWGPFGRESAARDEEIVRAARTAVGPEALLAVDAGGSDGFWRGDLKWALRTASMLAEFAVAWFEEPLRPDAMADHAVLRARSPVPIAGGEVLTRRQSFQPYLQQGCFDLVQPDCTKVGGLSESRRIGWLAEAHGVRLIPHGWNTAVGLAADLQLASALPDTDLVEYRTSAPYLDEITTAPPRLDPDGTLPIPDSPGLGVDLDPDRLARYTNAAALLIP